MCVCVRVCVCVCGGGGEGSAFNKGPVNSEGRMRHRKPARCSKDPGRCDTNWQFCRTGCADCILYTVVGSASEVLPQPVRVSAVLQGAFADCSVSPQGMNTELKHLRHVLSCGPKQRGDNRLKQNVPAPKCIGSDCKGGGGGEDPHHLMS